MLPKSSHLHINADMSGWDDAPAADNTHCDLPTAEDATIAQNMQATELDESFSAMQIEESDGPKRPRKAREYGTLTHILHLTPPSVLVPI
jgi:hypothetical protein